MKKIYLLLIAVVATNVLFAQNDPNAKKILDALSAKVKSFKAITGNFTIKSVTSKGKDNGTKTGSISIKGEKYVLKQGKTEVINDGSKTYSYDGNKTVTVTEASESNKSLTPQKILSGSYDKEFIYKLISAAGNFNEIELKPIDARKNFQKVTIFVDKAKGMITKAKVLDKSNNTLEFSFTNLNTSANLTDKTFIFNKAIYGKVVEVLD
jgi:outer membrane lipoprotein carrier protein